jgi:hypothetical protein
MWNVNISVDAFMFSLRRVGDVRDASWSSVPLFTLNQSLQSRVVVIGMHMHICDIS